MQTILTILTIIVMLGILVGMHELGHLAVAKAFNVYCFEYSIGFGPKVFSRLRKGGETSFSIRALPLGGFVSMYSEESQAPTDIAIPKERSIEGIHPFKRALVMMAGIIVNFFLSFLFTMIYAVSFASYYTASYVDTGLTSSNSYVLDEDKTSLTAKALCFWVQGKIEGAPIDSDHQKLYSPDVVVDSKGNQFGYLLDDRSTINGKTYCAVFLHKSVVHDNDIVTCTKFYEPMTGFFPNASQKELGMENYPDATRVYTPAIGDEIKMNLTFLTASSFDKRPSRKEFQDSKGHKVAFKMAVKNEKGEAKIVSESQVSVISYKYWAPLGKRLGNGLGYFRNFFVSLGEGLKSLFTFNFENLGSVVAMGNVVSTSSSEIGWGRTFFLYGGFLSLNLAFFNLLPFPGLDGWQLLVTTIEGTSKKKINPKIKNIVSLVGVALLLLLGVAIIIKDVVRLFL